MVADYFLVRRTRLVVDDLYRRGAMYEYRNGINGAAVISLIIGIVAALAGRFIPALEPLFTMAWFVGFFLSGGLYYVMMLGHRVQHAAAAE